MISLVGIKKSFQPDFWKPKTEVLKDVSFSIPAGKITGFLGANGEGKTTSLKILMDFIRADSGEVKFSKELGKSKNEILNNIGYLPEKATYYPHLTGKQFIEFMGELNKVKKYEINLRLEKWSKVLKIDHAINRNIQGYSKGMMQRLGLISAILHDPQVIILDEPLSGLDPSGRKQIKNILLDLNKKGKTIFFSSHIVGDVEEVSDQIVYLQDGVCKFQGPVDDLVQKNSSSTYEVIFSDCKIEEIKTKFIKSQKISENICLEVNENEADVLLKELIEKNAKIKSYQKMIPTLEEIIYHDI